MKASGKRLAAALVAMALLGGEAGAEWSNLFSSGATPTPSGGASEWPTEWATPAPTPGQATPEPVQAYSSDAYMDVTIPAGILDVDTVIASERYGIPITYTMPDGPGPYPLVVLSPGFLGNRDARGGFIGLAVALAEAGIASIRLDFAGCGLSEVDFSENDLSGMARDVAACVRWAKDSLPVDAGKIGLFGYSLGAVVTLRATLDQADICQATVLLAPGTINLRDIYRGAYQTALSYGYYTTVTDGRAYNVDVSWFEDLFSFEILFQAMGARENSLVIYGERDNFVRSEYAIQCADKLGALRVSVSGADHGMGLNGRNDAAFATVRDETVRFFVNILLEGGRVSATPSAAPVPTQSALMGSGTLFSAGGNAPPIAQPSPTPELPGGVLFQNPGE